MPRAPLGVEAAVFLTVSNVLYLTILVVSSFILYNRLYAHFINHEEWSENDKQFIGTYCTPAAALCLFHGFISSVMFFKLGTNDRAKIIRPDKLLWVWLLSFTSRDPFNSGRRECDIRCYTRFSVQHEWVRILNLILTIIASVIVAIFLPVTLVVTSYSREETIRIIVVGIQAFIVVIALCSNISFLDSYGFYSLIIVLASLLFLTLWMMALGVIFLLRLGQENRKTQFAGLFCAFYEFITLLTMCTICGALHYYDDTVKLMCVCALLNYLALNLPFTKWILFRFCKNSAMDSRLWVFLVSNPQYSEFALHDKQFCFLHTAFRHNYSVVESLLFDVVEDEQSSLLGTDRDHRIIDNKHRLFTIQCFKALHVYLSANKRRQKRMIRRLQPKRRRILVVSTIFYIHLFASLLAFLFPMFWFVYVWILNYVKQTSDIEHGLQLNAKNIFVWVLCTFQCVLNVVILSCILHQYTERRDIMQMVRHTNWLVYVWIMKPDLRAHLAKHAVEVLHSLPAVDVILNTPSLQSDIGLIVLSYLF